MRQSLRAVMVRLAALVIGAAALAASAQASAQTCYRLPFPNPTLSDGWGSTCCGRTNPHRGVDFPQGAGTAIPAVADGTVVIRTWSGCLGNVVVVQHADGMFSGYSHMLSASPLGPGTPVAMGTTVGQVGDTGSCSFGAHLHLTMGPTAESYWTGTTVDPYAYITARTTCNRAPVGYLDSASCDGISGWAQDPDRPDTAIEVHLYVGGPAGDPAAHGIAIVADRHRDDLCGAIGSCGHGFSTPLPLAFFDGVERGVHAYGIDAMGGANPQLGSSPRSFRCDTAPLPTYETGVVRRHVPSGEVLTAWRLGSMDIAPLPDAMLAALPDGPDVVPRPDLVQIEGMPEVYVRERGVLRHVQSPTVMAAWEFDFGAVRTVTAAELADDLRGAPWSSSPFLARGSQPEVYLLDAPPPLWAEPIGDDVPSELVAGTTAEVTFSLRNRGTMTWTEAVELAATPRDGASPLCDPSWPSCTRAAIVEGEVPPGAETTLRVRLRAPRDEGTLTACFNLVTGGHWFSDPGQNGPSDDAICRTIEIVSAVSDGGAPGVGRSDGGAIGHDGAPGDSAIAGSCSCRVGSASAPGASVAWLGVLGVVLARRRARGRS